MAANLLAILAMLAAGASIVLAFDSTGRAGDLRGLARDIDAETGRPGLRDHALAGKLAELSAVSTVTVTAGSRHGTKLIVAQGAGLVLTLLAFILGSSVTMPVATVSLALSGYIAVRFGAARQLRADGTRLRLRRWRTAVEIPLDAIQGVGFVPSRETATTQRDRIWLALWCDPSAVTDLPGSLTDAATLDGHSVWLRLDPIESISTAQLTRLMLVFGDRWTIGDANGRRPAATGDLAELFSNTERFGYDAETGHYSVDGVSVGHVVHRSPTTWRWWRTRILRDPNTLPLVLEVRDSLLRTRWVIAKPDAEWKTAFYVTDRQSNRVGTLRPTSATSRNIDICGTDNQVIATVRIGETSTTVVDTDGTAIGVWYTGSGELFSHAEPELRPLCLLSPIVLRYVDAARQGGASAGHEGPGQGREDTTVALDTRSDATADDQTVELPKSGQ